MTERNLDGWTERLRQQARRELAKAGATAAEIEEFMIGYEERLADWKRDRLTAERGELYEVEFYADALKAWEPEPRDAMH